MTQNQALTVADDAIVSALAAVGEIMPVRIRDQLIAASNWCWQRRLEKIDQPIRSAYRTACRLVTPHHESPFFDHDALTLEVIFEGEIDGRLTQELSRDQLY